jgi:hypothetical protein
VSAKAAPSRAKKTKTRASEKPLPWLLTEKEWAEFKLNPEFFRGRITQHLQDKVIPSKMYSLEEMRVWCRTSRTARARVAR